MQMNCDKIKCKGQSCTCNKTHHLSSFEAFAHKMAFSLKTILLPVVGEGICESFIFEKQLSDLRCFKTINYLKSFFLYSTSA